MVATAASSLFSGVSQSLQELKIQGELSRLTILRHSCCWKGKLEAENKYEFD